MRESQLFEWQKLNANLAANDFISSCSQQRMSIAWGLLFLDITQKTNRLVFLTDFLRVI